MEPLQYRSGSRNQIAVKEGQLGVCCLTWRVHAGRQAEASLSPMGYGCLIMVQQTDHEDFSESQNVVQDDRELGDNTFSNVHTEHWIQKQC